MIRVALARHAGVRRKERLRLHLSNHSGDGAEQIVFVIKPAVLKRQKPHVRHAEPLCRSDGFSLPDRDQCLRRRAFGRIVQPVAPVGADEEGHLLSRGRELRRRRARADLNVVRVRA